MPAMSARARDATHQARYDTPRAASCRSAAGSVSSGSRRRASATHRAGSRPRLLAAQAPASAQRGRAAPAKQSWVKRAQRMRQAPVERVRRARSSDPPDTSGVTSARTTCGVGLRSGAPRVRRGVHRFSRPSRSAQGVQSPRTGTERPLRRRKRPPKCRVTQTRVPLSARLPRSRASNRQPNACTLVCYQGQTNPSGRSSRPAQTIRLPKVSPWRGQGGWSLSRVRGPRAGILRRERNPAVAPQTT
jgi:hypothetical protein